MILIYFVATSIYYREDNVLIYRVVNLPLRALRLY